MSYYENVPRWIREVPRHLKTQEMCEEAVWIEPQYLSFIPNRFKSEGLCIKAVRRNPFALGCVPDNLKMQKYVTRQCEKTQQHFFLRLTILKHKKCVMMPLMSNLDR